MTADERRSIQPTWSMPGCVHRSFWKSMALALTCGACAGCGLISGVTTAWEEEVKLSDGTVLVVSRSYIRGSDEWFRPGRGGVLESRLAASVPKHGRIEFFWKGRELPVSFDVISGVPWIVLPIAGLNQCEKYGNPAESVVAFSRTDGKWNWRPFSEAPHELNANLLRGGPWGDETFVRLDAKHQRDRNIQGVKLLNGFIPEHTKWEHACHRTNPPLHADHELAIAALAGRTPRQLVAYASSADDRKLQLSQSEFAAIRKEAQEKADWNSCRHKIDKVEPVQGSWRDGSSINHGTRAYRIALSGGNAEGAAIYIPAEDKHLRKVVCMDDRIVAFLGSARKIKFSVLEYDLRGKLLDGRDYRVEEESVAEVASYGLMIKVADRGDSYVATVLRFEERNSENAPVVIRKRVEFVLPKAR